MTARALRLRRWRGSLAVRLAALLSLALLPIGAIAVVQSGQAAAVSRERAELALLGLTERAASRERRVVERALGTAEAAAVAVPALDDLAECSAFLRRVGGPGSLYSYVAFVPRDGIARCSTASRPFDFSTFPDFAELFTEPRPRVRVNAEAPVSGTSVLIVSHPVIGPGGDVLGIVSLSVPHRRLGEEAEPGGDVPYLMTFNPDGMVLTATGGIEEAAELLPAGVSLGAVASAPSTVFAGRDAAGRERTFAVVPVVPDVVYALGSWPGRAGAAMLGGVHAPAWVFPVAMWAASLAVSVLAVHWLAIGHIRDLMRRMRAFAEHRRIEEPRRARMPTEIADMDGNFALMTERILREEAESEDRLREQKVLLKEVHHRVKNNLQLISSIISMQMRELRSPEARFVLGRVRDRVLSLATIHRSLYEVGEVAGIDAAQTIRTVVDQLLLVGTQGDAVRVELDLESLPLYPDQAVPLSLLVTEAVSNALKYMGVPEGAERPTMRVALRREGEEALLVVANTLGRSMVDEMGARADMSTGLGRRLIAAFAMQLEGRAASAEEDGWHRLELRFRSRDFEEAPEAGDALSSPPAAAAQAAE